MGIHWMAFLERRVEGSDPQLLIRCSVANADARDC